MTQPRRHAGLIGYDHAEGVKGRERFGIDVRADGSRTVRAYCEMGDGDLTRDTGWTLDAAHRPIEGHVRVVQNGTLTGSSWYHVREQDVVCESLTADMGRTSQVLAGRRNYLGLHPLVGDGMIALAANIDWPGMRQMIAGVTCSYDIHGESTLMALAVDIAVTYHGEEDVEVPAGRFAAHRYGLQWSPAWPEAHLWVHGADGLFLRLKWEVSGLDAKLVRYDGYDAFF